MIHTTFTGDKELVYNFVPEDKNTINIWNIPSIPEEE